MSKVIAITGSSGMLGQFLCNHFTKKGFEVLQISRANKSLCINLSGAIDLDKISTSRCPDVIINCAFDFNDKKSTESNINFRICENLVAIARVWKCNNIINISTLSAYDDCKSIYGILKRKIEIYFLANSIASIRLGLLDQSPEVGVSALATKLVRLPLPVIPYIKHPGFTYETNVEEFCDYLISHDFQFQAAVYSYCKWEKVQIHNLLKRKTNKLLIPISWKIVFFTFKIIEKLGVKARFGSDSLIGLAYSNENIERNLYD